MRSINRFFFVGVLAIYFVALQACTTNPGSTSLVGRSTIIEGDVADSAGEFLPDSDTGWITEPIGSPRDNKTTHIAFADEHIGWIAAGNNINIRNLYKTTNGGKEWKRISLNFPDNTSIEELKFSDSMRGWVVLQRFPNSIYDAEFDPKSIQFWAFSTADGGATWNIALSEPGVRFMSFETLPGGLAVISGTRYLSNEFGAKDIYLMKTVDGGQSWVDLAPTVNDSMREDNANSPMRYVNDAAVALTLSNAQNFGFLTHSRRMLETSDGGSSWIKRIQYSHDDAQVGIKNFGKKDDGSDWMFESTYSIEGIRARLKILDRQGNLVRRAVHGVYLSSCYYLGDSSYIASGQTGDLRKNDKAVIWTTNDDGKTWKEVYRHSQREEVVAMTFVNRRLLWALVDDGTLLKLTRP